MPQAPSSASTLGSGKPVIEKIDVVPRISLVSTSSGAPVGLSAAA